MITAQQMQALTGAEVLGSGDGLLGRATGFLLDNSTGLPSWITVDTGSPETDGVLVPLAFADVVDGTIRVPYDAAILQFVPVRADGEPLTPDRESALYGYYGIHPTPAVPPPSESDTAPVASMVRSEERLQVAAERVAVGRAHLRKFVETELRTITVPVKRDVVRVVYEPLETDRATAWDPQDGGEDVGIDVVLTEERITVTTEVVAVERVRLTTVDVAGEQTVVAPVRSERVDVVTQRAQLGVAAVPDTSPR